MRSSPPSIAPNRGSTTSGNTAMGVMGLKLMALTIGLLLLAAFLMWISWRMMTRSKRQRDRERADTMSN
jgi:hypothetical protein